MTKLPLFPSDIIFFVPWLLAIILQKLEPRTDTPRVRNLTTSDIWPPPGIVSSVAGKLRIPNLSTEPHSLKRSEHFCQVSLVYSPDTPPCDMTTPSPSPSLPRSASTSQSTHVSLDPDNLAPDMRSKFSALLDEYHTVFDPSSQATFEIETVQTTIMSLE